MSSLTYQKMIFEDDADVSKLVEIYQAPEIARYLSISDNYFHYVTNNKNVHFLGYKQNVYQYIKQMDYLALLTDRESWGLVITEALILGVPCIATNFAGVEKQIINNENGIIIGMENCNNEYEKKIEDVLNLKKQLKNNIKGKNYNREHIITAWLNLLGN